jgi:hypothetical protein
MIRIMVNGVVGSDRTTALSWRVAGVWIDVEPGKIAARDVEPDTMALLEKVSRGGKRDLDQDDLFGTQKSGKFGRLAIACPLDRIANKVQ